MGLKGSPDQVPSDRAEGRTLHQLLECDVSFVPVAAWLSVLVQGSGVSASPISNVAEAPSAQNLQASTAAASKAQPAAGDVLIELRNVHKSFGNKPILRGANIQVRRGEAVGIIGGSGTGKSTTLRIMAGLLMPDVVSHRHLYMLTSVHTHAKATNAHAYSAGALRSNGCAE